MLTGVHGFVVAGLLLRTVQQAVQDGWGVQQSLELLRSSSYEGESLAHAKSDGLNDCDLGATNVWSIVMILPQRLKETMEADRARKAGKGGVSQAEKDRLVAEKEMQKRIEAAHAVK